MGSFPAVHVRLLPGHTSDFVKKKKKKKKGRKKKKKDAPMAAQTALGPVVPASVYCDWLREPAASSTSTSVW